MFQSGMRMYHPLSPHLSLHDMDDDDVECDDLDLPMMTGAGSCPDLSMVVDGQTQHIEVRTSLSKWVI